MDMFSGSQISSFLSATSLVWASSIVLFMVGLVYYIKFRERNDSIRNTKFFMLYIFTIILNILEYILNIVMQNNPFYETFIYKFYILIKFLLNLSILFYVISYIQTKMNNNNKTYNIAIRIIKVSLIVIALICCIVFDINVALENNGKFYVLIGPLDTVYSVWALISNCALLLIILWYRKALPKGFCILSFVTFFIYLGITIFMSITDYKVKESVFFYTILVLIIFNTTSNQDKEFVNNLNSKKNSLASLKNKRSKLINKLSYHIGQSLNNMILYNDELYLTQDKKGIIQQNSKEITETVDDLENYIKVVKDIHSLEKNKNLNNKLYQLNTLISNIDTKITPITDSKKLLFNISVSPNSLKNYIGDLDKIEMAINNIIMNMIHNAKEEDSIDLMIISKQYDINTVDLGISIKGSSNNNLDIELLKLDDFNNSNKDLNSYDLDLVISNEILQTLNSSLKIKNELNSTIYSFNILQGFHDNEIYE